MPLLPKYPPLVALILIAGFWFGLLSTSGTLTSGYHFMDDHEIVRLHSALQPQPQAIGELVVQWVRDDFANGRFRPLYYPHRILTTWAFGVNWWLWSCYVACLGIFTSYGLWLFAYQLNFSLGEGLLLAALTSLGPQTAVWWQLGPPETFGMAVLAIALLLTVQSARRGAQQPICEALWILTAILLSLCKESFILLIPALLCLKGWLTYNQIGNWGQTVRRHLIAGGILGCVIGAELLVIKLVIGLGGPGYGGVLGIQASDLWQAIAQISQVGAWWVVLPGYAALVIIALRFPPGSQEDPRTAWWPPLLLFGLILVPQVFLHAKTGLTQRYLLPGILGYAWLAIWAHRGLKGAHPWLGRLMLGLLIATLAFQLQTIWLSAQRFAAEGRSTQALLRSLETNTTSDSALLLVSHPRSYAEWSLALKSYLSGISDRPNLYLEVYSGQDTVFYHQLQQRFDQRISDQLPDKRVLQCITIFPELQKAFLKRSTDWFTPEDYHHWVFGPYNRAINPNSEIHLYCKK